MILCTISHWLNIHIKPLYHRMMHRESSNVSLMYAM